MVFEDLEEPCIQPNSDLSLCFGVTNKTEYMYDREG